MRTTGELKVWTGLAFEVLLRPSVDAFLCVTCGLDCTCTPFGNILK